MNRVLSLVDSAVQKRTRARIAQKRLHFDQSGFIDVAARDPATESSMTAPTGELDIRLKRAYEPPSKSDGTRVLIDRLWPRGLTKEEAGVDRWLRDIAPSTELRRWFGHDPARWHEFQRRYAAELKHRAELLDELLDLARKGTLTLIFGARDEEHNDAVVLKQLVLGRSKRPARST